MTTEANKLLERVHKEFEDFKQVNEERIAKIEKGEHVDPLIDEKLAKHNDAVDGLQKEVERLGTAMARKAAVPTGGDDMDQKAHDWAVNCAKRRGYQLDGEFGGSELKEYRDAFRAYMRKGVQAEEMHAKALSVGVDPDGGYTVEPNTDGRIVQKVYETSPMRQVAAQQTIGTDALEGLYDLDEASANWVGEDQTRDETNTPKLAKYRIPVHELAAFPFATQKVLDDSALDLEAWLADKVADKFARKENEAFVIGDGAGKPRGFLTYPDGTDLPGTIQQVKTGQTGDFASSPDGGDVLLDAIYAMKQTYRANARWHMSRVTTAEVRKLKDSEGRYLWAPGIAAGEPAQLLGFPVLEFEDMPEIADGALAIAFANMGEAYQIVDRHGIRVLRDPYTNKPFVGFYSIRRTGGDVLNFEAIKLIRFGS